MPLVAITAQSELNMRWMDMVVPPSKPGSGHQAQGGELARHDGDAGRVEREPVVTHHAGEPRSGHAVAQHGEARDQGVAGPHEQAREDAELDARLVAEADGA